MRVGECSCNSLVIYRDFWYAHSLTRWPEWQKMLNNLSNPGPFEWCSSQLLSRIVSCLFWLSTSIVLLYFFSVILVVYCLVCPLHVLWSFCLFICFFCLFRSYCESPSLLLLYFPSNSNGKGCPTAACSENSISLPSPVISLFPWPPMAIEPTLLNPTTRSITCDIACLFVCVCQC